MPIITPTVPPEPTPGEPWEKWDVYLRAVKIINEIAIEEAAEKRQAELLAAEAKRTEAQASTAAAMGRSAAVQQRMLDQDAAPVKPSRAELVLDLLRSWPHTRSDTEGGVVTIIKKQVDAFVAAYPGFTRD